MADLSLEQCSKEEIDHIQHIIHKNTALRGDSKPIDEFFLYDFGSYTARQYELSEGATIGEYTALTAIEQAKQQQQQHEPQQHEPHSDFMVYSHTHCDVYEIDATTLRSIIISLFSLDYYHAWYNQTIKARYKQYDFDFTTRLPVHETHDIHEEQVKKTHQMIQLQYLYNLHHNLQDKHIPYQPQSINQKLDESLKHIEIQHVSIEDPYLVRQIRKYLPNKAT